MPFPRHILLSVIVMLFVFAFAIPADAKRGRGNPHDMHDGHWKSERWHQQEDPVIITGRNKVIISNNDRVIIRDYWGSHYAKSCPPGLAKKHNGCLPPGHARRVVYVAGDVLPGDVIYAAPPRDLLVQLQPVPVGHRYVVVDGNVYLINQASRQILDGITLLSAVR